MEPKKQLYLWLAVLTILFSGLVTIFSIFPTKPSAESALALGPEIPIDNCPTTPSITFHLLSRNKSLPELTKWARSDPSAVSCALPQLVPQLYAGNLSAFIPLLSFVESLPTAENQIIGFSAIYDNIQRYSILPEVPQLLKLVENVKRLHHGTSSAANSSSKPIGASAMLKLANLIQHLSPLIFIGPKADCNITNAAYRHQLFATAHGYPDSVYLSPNEVEMEWRVQPSLRRGKLLFDIGESADVLYSSESNPNKYPRDPNFRLKTSERHVLMGNPVPPEADGEWKLVPVRGKRNHFRILASKTDAFMSAHRMTVSIDFGDVRRVMMVSKSGFQKNSDYISEADEWVLECRPVV